MKKMISSIMLLALVSSMIFSIPLSVYADSQSDSLIRIASQARDQVKIQLSKVDVTQEIKEKFEIGSEHIELLIEAARNELREGNVDLAISIIDEIKQSIVELNQILKEKTRQYTTDRAKTLAEKHLEDLDRLIEQAEEMEVSDDTLEKLLEAKKNLNSLSDASVEQIINEVKRIISVKQDFEKSKIDRIEARYQDLEAKIERLSDYSSDIPELDKAKTMYSELKDLVSSGSLNEAIRLLNSLNNLINEIQNSINEKEDIEAAAAEERQTSLSDSKTDRIKIKIQRLEATMNQLEEKVGDNAASKRWLNNAFSLLDDAKNQVDDSPDTALNTIMKIEQIIKRIQNTIQ